MLLWLVSVYFRNKIIQVNERRIGLGRKWFVMQNEQKKNALILSLCDAVIDGVFSIFFFRLFFLRNQENE